MSLWTETGLSKASTAEKAAFWREQLLQAAQEFSEGNFEDVRMLVPVFRDLPRWARDMLAHVYRNPQATEAMDVSRHSPFAELRAQLQNASNAQIVGYGNEYYRRKPHEGSSGRCGAIPVRESMKRLFLFLFLLLPGEARAVNEDRLRLTQMLLGEAGWRPINDHPAILHVLEKRRQLPAHAGASLTEMANRYSTFLKPNRDKNDLPHRTSIYSLTLETAPQWTVRLVDTFLASPASVVDPCQRRAWNWGSKTDTLYTKSARVDCGPTANVFLGIDARQVQVQ